METLKRVFFETPVAVYIVLAVAEAVVAAFWYSRRSRRLALALLAAPVLAAAIGLTAYLVETDREQINSALKAIGLAIEAGDVDAAAAYFDPACRAPARGGGSIDKGALIKTIRKTLRRWPVKQLRATGSKIHIEGNTATTRIKAQIILQRGDFIDSGWRLDWAKSEADWRVTRIEALYPPMLANWNI